MAQDCSLQMPEDFVLPLLPAEELKDKYRRYLFRDYVEVCVSGGGGLFAQQCQGCAVMAPETAEACGKGVRKLSEIPCVYSNEQISFTLRSPPPVFHFNIHGTSLKPMLITELSYTITVKILHSPFSESLPVAVMSRRRLSHRNQSAGAPGTQGAV